MNEGKSNSFLKEVKVTSAKKCQCSVCHNEFSFHKVTPLSVVRDSIFKLIKDANPKIEMNGFICINDLNVYRKKFFEKIMQDDRGDLDEIEATVLKALQERETISSNLNEEENEYLTFGEKISDKIAEFGGSWTFIIIFITTLTSWVIWNSLSRKIFDPYPYILLNLFLSMIAAIQAPIIMMSQNRQSARDRKRQEEDYKVNLKSEIDIRMMNEKIDKLISHQWQRMLEIQEMQLELSHDIKHGRTEE